MKPGLKNLNVLKDTGYRIELTVRVKTVINITNYLS